MSADLVSSVRSFNRFEIISKLNQRNGFRRYREGLLLPTERHKSLTGLADTEPVIGAQHRRAQALQWFLSQSTRVGTSCPAPTPPALALRPTDCTNNAGELAIDEHGDRKAGDKTAHIGRQYLSNLGKIDNDVVSVTGLWADERQYGMIFAKGSYRPGDDCSRCSGMASSGGIGATRAAQGAGEYP